MNNQPESSKQSSPVSEKGTELSHSTAADVAVEKRLVSITPEYRHYENSFIIEDSFYRSRQPKATHWSIAWSDLMMTMFILFLSMFVYQAAHQDFLINSTPEIVGGSTTEALDIEADTGLIVPIMPIKNKAPLITAGTVKKVEIVTIDDIDVDEIFQENAPLVRESVKPTEEPEPVETVTKQETTEVIEEKQEPPVIIPPVPSIAPVPSFTEDIIEPAPLLTVKEPQPEPEETDGFSEIYDMSKQALTTNKLNDFASVDLIPDTTMRIILTGDLLFSTGQADLSNKARKSLQMITAIIKNTPYMINVIGHTDNQPMHSARFATNWELSVVRASRVTRFLIEEMGMNSHQFIVSGYGANRPRVPNTNVTNRAANRRVEIIISKRLPPAVKATSGNLL